jgi:pSer/pThr/pTyr-binding forkhead associated (FHA) protein
LPAIPCGITISATERVVRLPDNGPVVIGRFEHGFTDPPDVDLAFADGEFPSVSRRHAQVTAINQRHRIEDLGTSNGTYVNGRQLPLGDKLVLSPGDRILLGMCRLSYAPLPKWMSQPDGRVPHLTYLIITHTGHRVDLPEKSELLIGRPDPSLGYEPDADMSIAGEIGMYVSRRHARLLQRGGWHFLQEMGSASGTRVNGKTIQPGESPLRLQPGDQLWLGGCVVAYEWELL